jgi:hypothetical protein
MLSLRGLVCPKKMGVTYSRSATGTGMPHRNAFRHARWGRAFKRCSVVKFPVSLRTAAEATQNCLGVFSGLLFLADADD